MKMWDSVGEDYYSFCFIIYFSFFIFSDENPKISKFPRGVWRVSAHQEAPPNRGWGLGRWSLWKKNDEDHDGNQRDLMVCTDVTSSCHRRCVHVLDADWLTVSADSATFEHLDVFLSSNLAPPCACGRFSI